MKWNLFPLLRNRKPARRQPYRKDRQLRLEWLEPRLAPSAVPITAGHLDYNLTGWNSQDKTLTPANVNDAGFGKLFNYTVDGYTYAQPLYMPSVTIPGTGGGTYNVVFAATEHDSLYAFNADAKSGGPANDGLLWQRTFLTPRTGFTVTTMPAGETLSGDIVPEVGITGTPVIDQASGTLYVVVKTKEVENSSGTAHYLQRLYAVDVTTGLDKVPPVVIGDTFGGNNNSSPISVPGTGAGSVNGVLTFNAQKENDRMALQLVTNPDSTKTVYLSYASHGDNGPYHGWVIGYNAADLSLQKVFNTSPNGSASGIWESGGNLGVDAQGNLYFATGNGFGTGNDVMNGGSTVVGPAGGALGYQGIGNSLAVTFRTYDSGHSSTGLGTNGNFATPNDLSGKIDFNAGAQAATPHTFQATLTYNGTTQVLTEKLQDLTAGTAAVTFTYNNVNLASLVGGNTAYVGFTGGTGGLNAEQDVLNWTFTGGGTTSINHPSGVAGATDLIANGSASLTAYPTATSPVGDFSYHQDIGVPGNPTPPGTASYDSTTKTYTLTGSGTDLGFKASNNDYDADRFQFVYNSMNGTTGSIIARVKDFVVPPPYNPNNPSDPTYWTKAIVQIRNSLDPQAQNVSVIMSPHNVSEMTWRDGFGGGTGAHERGTGTGPLPGWIRLDRSGDTFTGYWSTDGVNWTQGETHSSPGMGANVYVGLGFTSHYNGVTSTAHFDNVKITGFTAQTPPAAAVITPAANGQAGSIFSKTAVDVTNFSTTFNFRMVAGSNPIADGMTFTIQNQAPGKEYAESVIKLSPSGAGQNMTVADYFTPHDWQTLDNQDADLGSGGTMLLPDAVGSTAHPHLMIETGKTGRIYLIDRDNMGKFNSRIDPVLQTVQIGGPGVWGNPAFFQDGPNTGLIYYWGQSAPGLAYRITDGVINPIAASVTTFNMGFPGAQPSISSGGSGTGAASSGILWAIRSDNYGSNGPESLLALNAEDLTKVLWSSTDVTGRDAIGGTSVKFTFPIVDNGHVYAGSNGSLAVYGLLPANTTAPGAPSGLSGKALSPNQVELDWTNASPNTATLIKVERSTTSATAGFSQIAEVAGNATTFTDATTSPVTQYWYRVRATNQAGDSGYSNVVNVLTPIPSATLSVTNVTSTEVDLSWTQTGNAGYDVLRSSDGGTTFVTLNSTRLSSTTTTYSDTTVTDPHTYQYKIHAYNTGPTSDSFSNVVSAVVAPVDIEFPFPDGIGNADGLQFNGSAQYSPTEKVIRLNNDFNQGGSVFTTDRVNISQFSTSFWIRLHEGTQPNPADGLTFTVQADPRGPTALGVGGGGLGYQGINNSVAIKLDVYNNEGETPNSTGVFANGDYPGKPHGPNDVNVPLDPSVVNLQDQDRKRIDITYDASLAQNNLDVTITDETKHVLLPSAPYVVEQQYTINIPAIIGGNGAYVGFTGGTGGLFTLQDVLGWVFPPTAPPAPVNLKIAAGTDPSTGKPVANLTWTNTATNDKSIVVQRSIDNYHFDTLATLSVGPGDNHYTDTNVANNTTYFYRVGAVNDLGTGYTGAVQFILNATTINIDHSAGFASNGDLQANGNATFYNPSPAAGAAGLGIFTAHQDIGTAGDPGTPGSVTYDSTTGAYTLKASGSDIWGSDDHMQYVYKQLSSDGEIVARVQAENSTDYWTKAGLMIRANSPAGLTSGSPNAFMAETADGHNEPVFQWRTTQGGGTSDFGGHPGGDVGNKPPIWLRLVRSGNTFSGYWAQDLGGGNHGPWQDLAGDGSTRWNTQVISGIGVNDTVLVGLGLTAHNNGTVAQVTFDHVSVVTSARLTDGGGSEAGSVFYKTPVPITGTFNTSFVTDVRPVNGSADGFTFTIQSDSRGAGALGGGGGQLGYVGITPSLAVAFDLYAGNTHHATADVYVNGSIVQSIDMTSAGIDFTQVHTYQVDIAYDGFNLSESIKDLVSGKVFTSSYAVNLAGTLGTNSAYVGFTGGTGGQTAWLAVESWTASFVNAPPPPPHLEVTNYPASASGSPQTFSLTEKTAFGQVVQSYAGTVHFTSDDSKAILPDDYTFTAADKGTHQFAGVLFNVGKDKITATDNSKPQPLTDTETVLITPRSFTVTGFPQEVTAGDTDPFTVTALDYFGDTPTGYTGTVHLSSTDPNAVFYDDATGKPLAGNNYTFTAGDGGVHTFDATLTTAGTQSISVADTKTPAASKGSESGIVVNPGATSQFVVTGFPSPVTAGTAGNFTVTAEDAYGNLTPGYTGTVTFSSSDPQAALPADYTFTTGTGTGFDNGKHQFSATLKTAGSQSITATDAGDPAVTGSQSGIQVTAAKASQMAVGGFPSPVTAGTAGTFTVTIEDAYGNAATGYTGTVHVTSSDPQVAPIDHTYTATDAGTYNFTVTLKTAGTQSITATDNSSPALTGTQSGIEVDPAAANHFAVSGFPSPVTAGTAGTVTVKAEDPYGNTDPNFTGTVHLGSTDAKAVFDPDYTFTADDAGVHQMGGTLYTAGTQSITASGPIASGSQTGIVVNPAAPSQILVSGFPSPVTAGTPGSVNVTVEDAYGNVVTSYTGTVSLSSSDPKASGLSSYTFQGTADGGKHTFSGVTLKTAGTQSITATDNAAGISGTQDGIQVNPGAVSQFIVSGYPSPVAAGTSNDFTVTAADAYGNTVTGYTGKVHFSSDDSAAVLPSDYVFMASDHGSATFSASFGTTGTHYLRVVDAVFTSIAGEQDGIVVQ